MGTLQKSFKAAETMRFLLLLSLTVASALACGGGGAPAGVNKNKFIRLDRRYRTLAVLPPTQAMMYQEAGPPPTQSRIYSVLRSAQFQQGCDQLEAKVIEAQNQGWSMASIADIYTALQEYCPQTYKILCSWIASLL